MLNRSNPILATRPGVIVYDTMREIATPVEQHEWFKKMAPAKQAEYRKLHHAKTPHQLAANIKNRALANFHRGQANIHHNALRASMTTGGGKSQRHHAKMADLHERLADTHMKRARHISMMGMAGAREAANWQSFETALLLSNWAEQNVPPALQNPPRTESGVYSNRAEWINAVQKAHPNAIFRMNGNSSYAVAPDTDHTVGQWAETTKIGTLTETSRALSDYITGRYDSEQQWRAALIRQFPHVNIVYESAPPVLSAYDRKRNRILGVWNSKTKRGTMIADADPMTVESSAYTMRDRAMPYLKRPSHQLVIDTRGDAAINLTKFLDWVGDKASGGTGITMLATDNGGDEFQVYLDGDGADGCAVTKLLVDGKPVKEFSAAAGKWAEGPSSPYDGKIADHLPSANETRSPSGADWFKKMSPERQKRYLDAHPESVMKANGTPAAIRRAHRTVAAMHEKLRAEHTMTDHALASKHLELRHAHEYLGREWSDPQDAKETGRRVQQHMALEKHHLNEARKNGPLTNLHKQAAQAHRDAYHFYKESGQRGNGYSNWRKGQEHGTNAMDRSTRLGAPIPQEYAHLFTENRSVMNRALAEYASLLPLGDRKQYYALVKERPHAVEISNMLLKLVPVETAAPDGQWFHKLSKEAQAKYLDEHPKDHNKLSGVHGSSESHHAKMVAKLHAAGKSNSAEAKAHHAAQLAHISAGYKHASASAGELPSSKANEATKLAYGASRKADGLFSETATANPIAAVIAGFKAKHPQVKNIPLRPGFHCTEYQFPMSVDFLSDLKPLLKGWSENLMGGHDSYTNLGAVVTVIDKGGKAVGPKLQLTVVANSDETAGHGDSFKDGEDGLPRISEIYAKVIPVVREHIADQLRHEKAEKTSQPLQYRIVPYERLAHGGAVYLIQVVLHNAKDRQIVKGAVETFCGYDEEPIRVEGKSFHIGDGDDSEAVEETPTGFNIWLRWFADEETAVVAGIAVREFMQQAPALAHKAGIKATFQERRQDRNGVVVFLPPNIDAENLLIDLAKLSDKTKADMYVPLERQRANELQERLGREWSVLVGSDGKHVLQYMPNKETAGILNIAKAASASSDPEVVYFNRLRQRCWAGYRATYDQARDKGEGKAKPGWSGDTHYLFKPATNDRARKFQRAESEVNSVLYCLLKPEGKTCDQKTKDDAIRLCKAAGVNVTRSALPTDNEGPTNWDSMKGGSETSGVEPIDLGDDDVVDSGQGLSLEELEDADDADSEAIDRAKEIVMLGAEQLQHEANEIKERHGETAAGPAGLAKVEAALLAAGYTFQWKTMNGRNWVSREARHTVDTNFFHGSASWVSWERGRDASLKGSHEDNDAVEITAWLKALAKKDPEPGYKPGTKVKIVGGDDRGLTGVVVKSGFFIRKNPYVKVKIDRSGDSYNYWAANIRRTGK